MPAAGRETEKQPDPGLLHSAFRCGELPLTRAAHSNLAEIDAAAFVADFVLCPSCRHRASLAAVLESPAAATCPTCGQTMVYAVHAPTAARRESV